MNDSRIIGKPFWVEEILERREERGSNLGSCGHAR